MVQRHPVDVGVHVAGREQRRQRRREPQPAGRLGQVERLDAEPVPGQDHPAAVQLGDGEREHAHEVADAVDTPAVVGLADHLGVGGGEELVAVAAELVAELLVVVDAPVEHHGQPQLRIRHRLRPGRRQVDDREPPVGQCDPAVLPDAVTVGAARPQHTRHPGDRSQVGRGTVEPDLAGESAHGRRPYAGACRGCFRPPEPDLSTCPISFHRVEPLTSGGRAGTETAPVTPFDLALTVDPATGDDRSPRPGRLVLELPDRAPVVGGGRRGAAAAGLPPGRGPAMLGQGPVSTSALVGAPPLLTGVTLTTGPADTAPVGGPLGSAASPGRTPGRSLPVLARSVVIGRDPDRRSGASTTRTCRSGTPGSR